MIPKNITNLIDEKAKELNKDAFHHANEVSLIIKQLNNHINEIVSLSEKRIEMLLDHLVGFFTITLDIPLDKNTKIVRAVKFEEIKFKTPCYDEVSRLSYIPKSSEITPRLGRLNKQGSSIYYACISNKSQGIDVVLSEIKVLENETINILNSTLTEELFVRYIGVFDHLRRGVKPPFTIHPLFEEVYNYEKKMFHEYIMIAFGLCDTFFSDILRRKEHGKLFEVTSVLSSLFLEGDKVDGILYSSVQAEGAPILAIKPESIDKKVKHTDTVCLRVDKCFGYAIYYATTLYNGKIITDKINWTERK